MVIIGSILFLGNSITKHTPAPEIGWYGDWGMAASAEENDYVHLVTKKLPGFNPDISIMVQNIAEFERGFWEYDLGRLAQAHDFAADFIIVRIGENVDEQEASARGFNQYYLRLLEYICQRPQNALCVGSFWEKPCVNGQMEAAAAEYGCQYLDISCLGNGDEYKAIGLFSHEGVAGHPSDYGMKAIAGRICDAILMERG